MEFQPMSPEEMQRTMQFMLQQQAQFETNLARISEKTDRVAEGLIGLTSIVGQLAAAQLRAEQELKEEREQLMEQRAQLEEQGKQLKEQGGQLKEQGEQVKDQREHIDIIIKMFERHLREDHGPRPS